MLPPERNIFCKGDLVSRNDGTVAHVTVRSKPTVQLHCDYKFAVYAPISVEKIVIFMIITRTTITININNKAYLTKIPTDKRIESRTKSIKDFGNFGPPFPALHLLNPRSMYTRVSHAIVQYEFVPYHRDSPNTRN